MDEELVILLEQVSVALHAASGTYKLLDDLGMGRQLPGLGHTTRRNTETLNAVESYLKNKK